MKRSTIVLFLILCVIIVGVYGILYLRWSHLWDKEPNRPTYVISYQSSDTLRVVMIGDSWAAMQNTTSADFSMQRLLQDATGRPVYFLSKGKGGEKTRGIYQLLFEYGYYGMRHVIESGVDYCIISAGINDAAANLGIEQYAYHYQMILNFLTQHHIRPVILEFPDVDLWHLYGTKPLGNLVPDWLRSTMTGCKMYDYSEYRRALRRLNNDDNLENKWIYIPLEAWYGDGTAVKENLFLADRIHLNKKGYELLDSTITAAIANDLQSFKDSTLFYQPVGGNTKQRAENNK